MLSGLLDPATQTPRSRMLWAVLGALIAGQLAALWLLCSQQVRQAEARQTERHVQQLALADCLQYIPGATIATCTSRIGQGGIFPQGQGTTNGGAATAAMGAGAEPARGAMPVSFSR
jgi:hypothetical protein